ncbi:MAG: exodeoxyribonuclease VII large subunit [Ktedonobacterales bacterium]
MRIVGVSEITGYLKSLLDEDYLLQDVWVRGEITNYTQAASGHRYFDLKDAYAVLHCVLFKSSGSPLISVPPLQNGMAILAHGRMSLYEQRGNYQFYVDAVESAGEGELHLRFEALKSELEAQGLFAPSRKRRLPDCPAAIGVVTSPSAAALRDIVRTLRLRCPLVRLILAPVLVQGDGAAEQVATALDQLNACGEVDTIIVARGGGSLEELWAFNEETVARAIARSRIPVVTGIGHETDFTIADFVADLRASTPTAAAIAAAPDAAAWRVALEEGTQRLAFLTLNRLQMERRQVSSSFRQLEKSSPRRILSAARQHVDESQHQLEATLRHLTQLRQEHLRGSALRLHALSPLLTIGRGFAVVRRSSDGRRVTSVTDVTPGQGLSIRVADGSFAATAGPRLEISQPDVASAPVPNPAGSEITPTSHSKRPGGRHGK